MRDEYIKFIQRLHKQDVSNEEITDFVLEAYPMLCNGFKNVSKVSNETRKGNVADVAVLQTSRHAKWLVE